MHKFLIIFFSIVANIAFAGGFQLNIQGTKAVGIGGAFTGKCTDASALYFNPGGLMNLKSQNLIFGTHIIVPSVSLQTDYYDNINQTTGNATPVHFYYSGRYKEKLAYGLGVNNQFGSASSFADDWQGRYIIQNISLRTFMFQPTVAYKIHDRISIGAGFVYTTGSFSYEKAVPLSSVNILYGKARLTGKGKAYGYNVGIFSNVFEKEISSGVISLTAGLSYRSGMKIKLKDGKAEFINIPNSMRSTFPIETGFTAELNLPSVISGGFCFDFAKGESWNVNLNYEINRTGWSTYDTLAFDFENEETPDSKVTKNWDNVFAHRTGVEFVYKELAALRIGCYYDNSPIPDGYVSPELPDSDNLSFTAGVGFYGVKNLSVDFSFIRQVAERDGELVDEGFSAIYRRKVNIYGISLGYALDWKKKQKLAPQVE